MGKTGDAPAPPVIIREKTKEIPGSEARFASMAISRAAFACQYNVSSMARNDAAKGCNGKRDIPRKKRAVKPWGHATPPHSPG